MTSRPHRGRRVDARKRLVDAASTVSPRSMARCRPGFTYWKSSAGHRPGTRCGTSRRHGRAGRCMASRRSEGRHRCARPADAGQQPHARGIAAGNSRCDGCRAFPGGRRHHARQGAHDGVSRTFSPCHRRATRGILRARRAGRRPGRARRSPLAWCRSRWARRRRGVNRPAAYTGVGAFKPSTLSVVWAWCRSRLASIPSVPSAGRLPMPPYWRLALRRHIFGLDQPHPAAVRIIALSDPHVADRAAPCVRDAIDASEIACAWQGSRSSNASASVPFVELLTHHRTVLLFEMARMHAARAEGPPRTATCRRSRRRAVTDGGGLPRRAAPSRHRQTAVLAVDA